MYASLYSSSQIQSKEIEKLHSTPTNRESAFFNKTVYFLTPTLQTKVDSFFTCLEQLFSVVKKAHQEPSFILYKLEAVAALGALGMYFLRSPTQANYKDSIGEELFYLSIGVAFAAVECFVLFKKQSSHTINPPIPRSLKTQQNNSQVKNPNLPDSSTTASNTLTLYEQGRFTQRTPRITLTQAGRQILSDPSSLNNPILKDQDRDLFIQTLFHQNTQAQQPLLALTAPPTLSSVGKVQTAANFYFTPASPTLSEQELPTEGNRRVPITQAGRQILSRPFIPLGKPIFRDWYRDSTQTQQPLLALTAPPPTPSADTPEDASPLTENLVVGASAPHDPSASLTPSTLPINTAKPATIPKAPPLPPFFNTTASSAQEIGTVQKRYTVKELRAVMQEQPTTQGQGISAAIHKPSTKLPDSSHEKSYRTNPSKSSSKQKKTPYVSPGKAVKAKKTTLSKLLSFNKIAGKWTVKTNF